MKHGNVRIRNVMVKEPYKIEVEFDDGKQTTIDLEFLLEGELFSPLKNPDLFSRVKLDPETGTIQWPNGADFDPETLYHWNQ